VAPDGIGKYQVASWYQVVLGGAAKSVQSEPRHGQHVVSTWSARGQNFHLGGGCRQGLPWRADSKVPVPARRQQAQIGSNNPVASNRTRCQKEVLKMVERPKNWARKQKTDNKEQVTSHNKLRTHKIQNTTY
jgi:hypothetical protein